jgi:hypothetical protein
MTRRYTPGQLQNLIRQAQQKQRQAINNVNNAIRKYNSDVRRAVDNYNREVRAHNSRVQANRQRLRSAFSRLASSTTTTRTFVSYRTSVETLHRSYVRLENDVGGRDLSPQQDLLIDLSARETANSLQVANSLWSTGSAQESDIVENTEIVDELKEIALDLDHRWRGAVFALSPRNPDAARHFCASAREIFVQILEIAAPESSVLQWTPEPPRTQDGRITRRARLRFMLSRQGTALDALEDFAEENMNNVMELFQVFNDGTHGTAGTYSYDQLRVIRTRVESGLQFLCQVARRN